jgi:hypothetical protein
LAKHSYFNILLDGSGDVRAAATHPFLPGGKICRFLASQNQAA